MELYGFLAARGVVAILGLPVLTQQKARIADFSINYVDKNRKKVDDEIQSISI
jgi:hypothetical protein